jgi:hypothetical protein
MSVAMSAEIHRGRFTVEMPTDFVVFTGQSAARRIGAAAVDEPALAPYANP